MVMELKEKVRTRADYGLGGRCTADLPRGRVEGRTVRELLSTIVDTPQSSDPSRKTAQALKELLGSSRTFDLEVVCGPHDITSPGEPAELDDPVPPIDRSGDRTDTLSIRVSETYVGGDNA